MSDRKPRRWRHKPDVLTEAEAWTGVLADLPNEWLELDVISLDPLSGNAIVRTEQGPAEARLGDYIARGHGAREFYVVLRAIHRDIYELIGGGDE